MAKKTPSPQDWLEFAIKFNQSWDDGKLLGIQTECPHESGSCESGDQ